MSNPSTDLVIRLRDWTDRARIPLTRSALVLEAADEIERLRADNAVLRAEMAHYEAQPDDGEALSRG